MTEHTKPDLKIVEFKKVEKKEEPHLTLAERFRVVAEMIEKGADTDFTTAESAIILLRDAKGGYVTLLAGSKVPQRSDIIWLLENVKMDCMLGARA